MIFFTADLHLNHEKIIKYTGRPFKDVNEMNNTIITNWNSIVNHDDTVYHIGDFAFCWVKDLKHNEIVPYWESKLNGKIVHIKGNHDDSIRPCIDTALIKFSGLNILIQHHPPFSQLEVPEFCNLVLCGHIHEKWKVQWLDYPNKNRKIPVVNVGVDQWDFLPISKDDIVKYYKEII
jgi:calcineurin-like phosphoesterase family protein